MTQLSFSGEAQLRRIVNVASVTQRSPFRYPGGKTWLVPRIRQWLRRLPTKPAEFIEPFVGGGIVSLSVAFDRLADHVTMVELDDQVAAVWRTIIHGKGAWLASQVKEFDCTPENVQKVLAAIPETLEEKAFQTILKNRVYHGGILAPGSGVIKYGENGKGIRSRWYPETLSRRILSIVEIKNRLTFIEGDGMRILRENSRRSDATFFIDPPYTAAGKKAGTRLYSCFYLDHEKLFDIVSGLAGDFLMTYDNAPEVALLARQHEFDVETIPMTNTHHAKMTELLIGRNLDWLRYGE